MTLRIPSRVVVFDYGEVISISPTERDRAELLALAGIDPAADAEFWASYWAHRDGLDQGTLSVHDYWALIAAEIGVEWSASTVQMLWACDFRGWISVEPGTIDLIDEMYRGGTRLALLSNAGFDFAGPFRYSPMGRYFERIFVSAEMDAIKPDPAIYAEVADELGIDLTDMVFVDNKSINTDAAAALGVTTHHFVGVAGLRDFLTNLAEREVA
ncbi:HAD-IA family hydrolase [Glaciihabitans sp. dw_435]|uniref:HAD-IA family hydrolase n=1 Tax=Glaciihabitans sp. dw_435 TaxID=2720081 RepID=UPI001BD58AF3|nr:HAD-IA family hydrolase [Glaciihabitans sp. dw_435]